MIRYKNHLSLVLGIFLAAMVSGLVLWPGCAPVDQVAIKETSAVGELDFLGTLHETRADDGNWRGHYLQECDLDPEVPSGVEKLLGLSMEFFREGSGSDGMIELEMALDSGVRHSLIDLTLGQLYLLAGQGEPGLLPAEGPAADVGNWARNKIRLLERARELLYRAQAQRPSDAVADYLLSDVARAQGEPELAANLATQARGKCTGGHSLALLRLYQQLNRYPAKYLGGASPEYPADALARGVSGEVTIDLLLDPSGQIRQAVTLESPDFSLTQSAFKALREGQFEAARVGKYPVWCWLEVTIAFNLDP